MKLGLAIILCAGALLAQPSTSTGETAKLLFRSAPLRGGSIEQQVNGAVKDLKKSGELVKLRAFVTSETALNTVTAAIQKTAGKTAVLNFVQIARLPDPQAVVLLEGVMASRKIENSGGLAFISGQLTQSPTGALVPLTERSVANLKSIATAVEAQADGVVRVNCYISSMDEAPQVRAAVTAVFTNADVSVMQIQRSPANQFVECDAVVRLRIKPNDAVRLLNPTQAAFAQAAIVTAPRILFTSTFTATADSDAAVRGAFAELKNAVGDPARIFYAYAYPGTQALLDKYRALRFELFVRANAPASTNLVFEGSGLGMDAMALPPPR